MDKIITFLSGKKTYGAVAIGLVYLAGVKFGWWPYDTAVLSAIGLSGLGFLRAAVSKGATIASLTVIGLMGLMGPMARGQSTNPAATVTVIVPATTNTLPIQSLGDVQGFINNALGNLNTNVDLFAGQTIELRFGGVYATGTGDAGALVDLSWWGLATNGFWANVGLGGQIIEGNVNGSSGTEAAFAYAEYRKSLGNVAAGVFAGAGYDAVRDAEMGVAGVVIEYKPSKNLGTWASFGGAFEASQKDRGIIVGGGISYGF